MPKLKQQQEVCSVALALEVLGDRWTLLVIRDAFYGVRRFQDFRESIGLAKNTLSDRLNKLVANDVMCTVPYGSGGWVEYHLTPKGRDLLPSILALMQWGDRWENTPDQIPVEIVDKAKRKPLAPLVARSASGSELSDQDITIALRPGATLPAAQRQMTVYSRLHQDQ